MKDTFEQDLKKYLNENGINEVGTDKKELLKLLSKLVERRKADLDWTDMKYSYGQSGLTPEEYGTAVKNLQLSIFKGNYFLANVRAEVKQENKKNRINKIKTLFKVKKNS